jgi:uncharacterized protein YndB with AHSA1/START domain
MTTFSATRHIAASPSQVFAAMADATRLARWWGPAGFTNRFEVCEFQPGGRWVFTMIGPDGATYPNESTFVTIEADRKVVIRHVNQPHFQLSIALEPVPGGTRLQWDQTFEDANVAAAIRHIVEPANEQNLDRLAAELGVCAGPSAPSEPSAPAA